jgi:taurine dioxygenase
MRNSGFELRPVTPHCGAEVVGLDLAAEVAPETVSGLRDALSNHGVLFFRGQKLAPPDQIAFARRFGEIDINPIYAAHPDHPEVMPVVKEVDDRHNIGENWHSDMTWAEIPPLGSLLYAREVPPVGGDTLWVNSTAAYEALSDGMRRLIGGLHAVHSDRILSAMARERNATRSTRLREEIAERPPREATHPVVRTDPVTGRPGLFVNRAFTWCFEGMTREESLPLLFWLCDHAEREEFQVRHRWRAGDLAFWDNGVTQHKALNDYHGHRREMHRITVVGTRPQ